MGSHSGYITGPLQIAAGAGATALGAPEIGLPLMTAGIGQTAGQAAGGSQGAGIGELAGGAAGGIGSMAGGAGMLGSLMGSQGVGMADPTAVNSALQSNPALAGLTPQSFAPGQIGPSALHPSMWPGMGGDTGGAPNMSSMMNSPVAGQVAGAALRPPQQPQASPLRPAMPGQSGPPQVQTPQAAPNLGAPMAGGPMNMSSGGLTPQQLMMIRQLSMSGAA